MITTIQKGVKTDLVNESTGVQAEGMPALFGPAHYGPTLPRGRQPIQDHPSATSSDTSTHILKIQHKQNKRNTEPLKGKKKPAELPIMGDYQDESSDKLTKSGILQQKHLQSFVTIKQDRKYELTLLGINHLSQYLRVRKKNLPRHNSPLAACSQISDAASMELSCDERALGSIPVLCIELM